MYNVRFNTGAGDIAGITTLDEAMRCADEGAAYTQRDIEIVDDNDKTVAARIWRKSKFDPDDYENGEDADVISYGDYGYFDEWTLF